MKTETLSLLYGHKIGQPSYTEQLLCSQPERFEEVRQLAARDGYTGFRIATHRDGERPDFAAALKTRRR